MYASQKIQVSSRLRRPETHFRHAQGHQQAGALPGSVDIIQNKIITVFGVEQQKKINRKHEKQTN